MTYNEWFVKQGNLHKNVMKRLYKNSIDERATCKFNPHQVANFSL